MLYRTLAATLVSLSLVCFAAAEEFSTPAIDLGMVVGDVAKSVKFYTEAVGCTEIEGFKVDGAYVGEVGLTDGTEPLDVHVLVLADVPHATKFKLMQFKRAPSQDDNAAINSQLGFRYLTLWVSDSTAALERLKKAGVKTLAGTPRTLPPGFPQDMQLIVVRDPDGNFVELIGPKK